jgi:hypothetical protein
LREASWLSPLRIRRIGIVCALILPVALSLECWLHVDTYGQRIQLTQGDTVSLPLGEDFANFWSGAVLAVQGHARTVYSIKDFLDYELSHTAPFPQFRWYAYPPVTLLLSVPLALFGYISAYAFWLVSGTILCAALFARFLRRPEAALASLAPPAVFFNAVSGQNGQFTAALMAGGLLLLSRRPISAGILFGALCYKPQFALLLPVVLIADQRWHTFWSAGVTAAVLVGASVLVFGWEPWAAYLHNAPINQMVLEQGHLPLMGSNSDTSATCWHRMPTMYVALRMVGASSSFAYFFQVLSGMSAAVLAFMVWRTNAPLEVKGAVLVLATLLATPYAWDYDLIVLTFAIVWLWQDASRTGFQPWERIALATTLAMTIIFSPIAKFSNIQFEPILFWITLGFAYRRARRPASASQYTNWLRRLA